MAQSDMSPGTSIEIQNIRHPNNQIFHTKADRASLNILE